MRAEDLVFWLDVLPEHPEDGAAVLCLRHADSMVVPRGWTLDDLRDPDLHLFRPPLPAPTLRTRAPRQPRSRAGADPTGEQLRLRTDDDSSSGDESPTADDEMPTGESSGAGPWSPAFDEADDLDGLLSARGPLLSRAFRTAERPDA